MTETQWPIPELSSVMFGVAYRMLGSVASAEDVVQEGLLRLHALPAAEAADVRSPEAYATTVATRLAIDELRSARARREQYVGTWLPEPLPAARTETRLGADPASTVEFDETMTIAFLMLLEELTPLERAVFVLREPLGYSYADIAEIVGMSQVNCRQALSRARSRIRSAKSGAAPRFAVSPAEQDELAAAFFAACRDGDLAALERLLADDVAFYGDGGGKAQAIRQPVLGRDAVLRFLGGLLRQGERIGASIVPTVVNGRLGGCTYTADGDLIGIMSLEFADGRLLAIRNLLNPDKLERWR